MDSLPPVWPSIPQGDARGRTSGPQREQPWRLHLMTFPSHRAPPCRHLRGLWSLVPGRKSHTRRVVWPHLPQLWCRCAEAAKTELFVPFERSFALQAAVDRCFELVVKPKSCASWFRAGRGHPTGLQPGSSKAPLRSRRTPARGHGIQHSRAHRHGPCVCLCERE